MVAPPERGGVGQAAAVPFRQSPHCVRAVHLDDDALAAAAADSQVGRLDEHAIGADSEREREVELAALEHRLLEVAAGKAEANQVPLDKERRI